MKNEYERNKKTFYCKDARWRLFEWAVSKERDNNGKFAGQKNITKSFVMSNLIDQYINKVKQQFCEGNEKMPYTVKCENCNNFGLDINFKFVGDGSNRRYFCSEECQKEYEKKKAEKITPKIQ